MIRAQAALGARELRVQVSHPPDDQALVLVLVDSVSWF